MESKKKNIYVLGTGLSHDGSACLLKDGKICVAIEKERLTRRKHDGYCDTEAINYCLEAEGIGLADLDLVVQNSNYGFFEYGNEYFKNQKRLFGPNAGDLRIVTISHHLAHAYYALGTSPFKKCAILVLDGCGSLHDECIDLAGAVSPANIPDEIKHLYAEKDSFYVYKNNKLSTLRKDFSPFGQMLKEYPMHPSTTKHSIGGLYSAASLYCFGNDADTGKLMGLAPYGRPNIYNEEIFVLKGGNVLVNYNWMNKFREPARSIDAFWRNFQYYADIAYWVQRETERAVLYVVRSRKEITDEENFCYTGGVALNAVVNGLLLKENMFKHSYISPAAADNGIAIGCAYYGWMEVIKMERQMHNGSSFFGKSYNKEAIERELQHFTLPDGKAIERVINAFFRNVGLFFNKDASVKDKCVFQFVIAGVDVFNLQVSKSEIVRLVDQCDNPDCILATSSSSFMRVIRDRSFLRGFLSDGTAALIGDLGYLEKVINVESLVDFIQKLMLEQEDFAKVAYRREANISKTTASLLAQGKVIAWFQGGCEFGPRALGHRSILADPRQKGIQKFINNKIKFREDFRPFAPAVLEDRANDFFEVSGHSPYMNVVSPVKLEWKDKLGGVVHVDGSCRVQTVNESWNLEFFNLITEFDKLTGIPILLNTSLNCKGMPIVETPLQALNYFFSCALDYLVIGDFLVSKEVSFGNSLGDEKTLTDNEVSVNVSNP